MIATHTKPKVINLKDYQPSDFLIDSVFLYFDLHDDVTYVKSVLALRRNPQSKHSHAPLKLHGEELALKSILINGKPLTIEDYQLTEENLTISKVPDQFNLETEVVIYPQKNTQLSGLYQSSGNFCTQCEPEGFRRITYYLDRSDVMSRFTTCIAADKKRYPILLSNGNLIETKELANNRHWVKWEDPSLKPSYLFALVAGDFDCLEDKYITQTGRTVALKIYVEKGKLDQTSFAMESLKAAMRWDEITYGREYELDIYMIVSVSDFNMGAMENKGLNLFNDRYVLANPKTATDNDFIRLEGVIGHEYFHNWTGNRITCRDWFQITLKEGLTIFRDQSFIADLYSPVVKRIEDVNVIRTAQFAQDAGPMAHPIRPDSYIEINNFYTVTVYNKGSEVIRMIQTIIGKENFRKGMDLYFQRHDGQAVTTEEFIKAMEDASGVDLTQFRRWYTQAGTPVLDIKTHYDSNDKTYAITVTQSCPPTPEESHKKDFYIPLAIGLLDPVTGEDLLNPATQILNIKQKTETFQFKNMTQQPIPSLLRNFSAPVKLNYDYSDDDLLFLLTHDSDGFNRWDAGQKLATKIIFQLVQEYRQQHPLTLSSAFIKSFNIALNDSKLDLALMTQMLILPRMSYLMELMTIIDVEALHHVREFIKTELARELKTAFLQQYRNNHILKPYHFDAKSMGQRELKNLCLGYLMQTNEVILRKLAIDQFHQADNMTDQMGALGALMNTDCTERTTIFAEFYQQWQHESLVVDKWFSLQALSTLPDTLNTVKKLLKHPAFNLKNPNRVRALIGSFCHGNYINFHAKDGSGYEFLADQVIIIDRLNAILAARLLEPLTQWRKFDKHHQDLMRAQLERIAKEPKLSKDVYEVVSKSLG